MEHFYILSFTDIFFNIVFVKDLCLCTVCLSKSLQVHKGEIFLFLTSKNIEY